MAFYQNLKLIMDTKCLSNNQTAKLCEMSPQTIDNIINKKVTKPKNDTLEKLSKGLKVTKNKLMFGTDIFEAKKFYAVLEEKNVTLEDLAINTNIDPLLILKNEIPPETQQKNAAEYLGVTIEELFIPSRLGIGHLKCKNVKPYLRPDVNSDPNTDEDIARLYSYLSPLSKRLVYNLAYDLSVIETENIVTLTPKDYWEK